MKRDVGLVALLFALPVPALAGFGLCPPPVGVTVSAYYYPVWYTPVYVAPAPACVPAAVPAYPTPPARVMPRVEESRSCPAQRPSVEAAPPSGTPVLPKPHIEVESSLDRGEFIPAKSETASSSRVLRSYVPGTTDQPYFDVRPVRLDPALRPQGYAVLFANLSRESLRLEVAGRTYRLAAGDRLLLETGQEFRWRIEGRPEETTRVPSRDEGLVIAIGR